VRKEMLATYLSLRNSAKTMLKSKKGADMVEWVAIIAVVVGIVMIISPQARSSISGLFGSIFGNLSRMSVGN
jgi:Flp pilus assembly pilin Flp